MSEGMRDFVAIRDVAAAIGLLTRLPVSLDFEKAQARGARAAWAWPIAGALVGGIAALAGSAALWLGLPSALAAALALATLIIITGAMHEDGLADCADGFWGGWTAQQRLDIMKDSRIGAYGVIAIGLSLILRWQALALVFGLDAVWPVLIGAGALSRAPMVTMMALMPPARDGGLSRAVGRPSGATAGLAAAVGVAIGALALGTAGIWAILWVSVLGLGWAALCRAKIGGQTGDTLGALQQIAEMGILLAICAALA